MITIIDYRAGNLASVRLAFESLGAGVQVTGAATRIRQADRVVFPGVGAAGAAMRYLRESGLADAIREVIRGGTPFLGICLGTQILFSHSEEDGGTDMLEIIAGKVQRFRPGNPYDKVPHMGWNAVHQVTRHPVFNAIEEATEFYFVHSYYPVPADRAVVLGETTYADARFAAAVGSRNLVATQFHPEKSGQPGLRMLDNFRHWSPSAC